MITVQHSDAVDLLRSVPVGGAQVIIADPPYALPFMRRGHEGYFHPAAFLSAADAALAETGALYVFTRWDVYPLWLGLAPEGLELKNAIVWVKDSWTAGDLGGNFGMAYEVILFFTKRKHKRQGRRWSNVWTFPRVPSKKLRIATEKPPDLIARIVEAAAVAGDLVIDPYCGSGTTGEALRRFRGVMGLLGDLDPKMVRMTCERLNLPVPELPEFFVGALPIDPVIKVAPPDPHLWGIHPEDLARFLRRNEPESATAEEGSIDVLTAIETIERLEADDT